MLPDKDKDIEIVQAEPEDGVFVSQSPIDEEEEDRQ
jgi:hypothetical protein